MKYRVTIHKVMVFEVDATSEATAAGYAIVAANGDLNQNDLIQKKVKFIEKDSEVKSIEPIAA